MCVQYAKFMLLEVTVTGKYFCFSCCLLFACLSPLNAQQSSTETRHDEWSGQRGLENEIIVLEHKYWEA